MYLKLRGKLSIVYSLYPIIDDTNSLYIDTVCKKQFRHHLYHSDFNHATHKHFLGYPIYPHIQLKVLPQVYGVLLI